MPVIGHCDCCEQPIPDGADRFVHEDGGDICANCTIALLRQERDIAQRALQRIARGDEWPEGPSAQMIAREALDA